MDAKTPQHGTLSRYTNNSCRCPSCTAAWNAYYREYVRDRRQWLKKHPALVEGWREILHQGEGQ